MIYSSPTRHCSETVSSPADEKGLMRSNALNRFNLYKLQSIDYIAERQHSAKSATERIWHFKCSFHFPFRTEITLCIAFD